MISKELAQQALDALNFPSMKTTGMLMQRDAAIEALRAAIAQPESEPVGHLAMDGYFIQNQRYVMENGKVPRAMPLYLAPGAQPVPEITKESIRACGGIVHADGNVFFTGIRQIKAMLEAAKETK